MKPLIDIEGLSYGYPSPGGKSEMILHQVSLTIDRGEYVAIVGANGSGKTTLTRHFNASLLPTQGRVVIDGLDTKEKKNHTAIRQKVGVVFQFPEDQVIATTVEDDVAFGLENLGLPSQEIRQRVENVLQMVGLWEVRHRQPHLLSAGQIQRLALAGVISMQPACIVFDEATTMLDPAGRSVVLRQMQQLHRQGISIVFVTHSMGEAALADRVLVMNAGRVVGDGKPGEIFASEYPLEAYHLKFPPVTALAGRMRSYFPRIPRSVFDVQTLIDHIPNGESIHLEKTEPLPVEIPTPYPQDILIDVHDLGHVYLAGTPMEQRSLYSANLNIKTGCSHGFVGATGSGKSTLLQHLNGILRPQEGTVRVGRFSLNDLKLSTREVVQTVGMVFQNPEIQFFETYVGDEIAFGPRQYPLDEPLSQRVQGAMQLVGLDFDAFKDRLVHTLSGGEKRKVALASALALKPEILLLDEPMAGLDPRARDEVTLSLQQMQEKGVVLVLCSHLMEDLVELTGAVTVFHMGTTLATGPTGDVFTDATLLQKAGLEAPMIVQVMMGMELKNWHFPKEAQQIVSESQFFSCLERMMGDSR